MVLTLLVLLSFSYSKSLLEKRNFMPVIKYDNNISKIIIRPINSLKYISFRLIINEQMVYGIKI